MLRGREEEQQVIDGLVARARDSQGGCLLLRGPAGIGKTALLDHTASRAEGIQVVRARGVELESALPYASLDMLLAPLLRRLDRLPPFQRDALTGALSLGPAPAHDPVAVCAATLALLAAAAEDSPLLALVDDVQWVDPSSRQALVFAARRLGRDPVAMVLAARDDGTTSLGDFDELRLKGLANGAARELLDAGPTVAPGVAERIVAASGGNPLALEEIPRLLNEAQRAGREPLDEPLPAGPRLEQALLGRAATLSPEAREALLVEAASGSSDAAVVAKALRSQGLPVDPVRPEEAADLAHPLFLSAIYHAAEPAARRRAHRALAHALPSGSSEQAWHLAAAADGCDEAAAAALEAVAHESARRFSYVEAAAAATRAATLTADPQARARRLFDAAVAHREAGHPSRAAAVLDEALALGPELPLRAAIQQLRLRGDVAVPHEEALSLLLAEAEATRDTAPDLAVSLLLDAAESALEAVDQDAAVAATQEAVRVAERGAPWTRRWAQAMLASALVQAGRPDEAAPYLDACVEALHDPGWLTGSPRLPTRVAAALIFTEEFRRAGGVLEGTIATAREAGAASSLADLLSMRSELEYRDGRWRLAYADAAESLALVRALGRPPNYFRIARLEAVLGREESCRRHAEEQDRRLGADGGAGLALALLALPGGRLEEAAEHLEALAPYGGYPDPAFFPWEQELVEVYIRLGRTSEALEALEQLEARAAGTRRASALAAARRCRGLLDDLGFEGHFEQALAEHERCLWPFERARTELCYGERLRRAGRRREARERLRGALDTFAALGAEPWAGWAQRELRASGETARRRDVVTSDELTPQELQVARVIAGGLTNKQAAAALFLSPKTIEFHLGNAYRKLGIHSRSQLVRLFPEESAA